MGENKGSSKRKRSMIMTKTKKMWLAWGAMYLLCTGLSFIPQPSTGLSGLLLLLSLGFFVPPVMLSVYGLKEKNRKLLKILRNVSLLSLSLTLLLIVLNFLTVEASAAWGTALYWLLILVSCPMVCAQVWVVGLFGWAVVLMASLNYLKKA